MEINCKSYRFYSNKRRPQINGPPFIRIIKGHLLSFWAERNGTECNRHTLPNEGDIFVPFGSVGDYRRSKVNFQAERCKLFAIGSVPSKKASDPLVSFM
uniref:Uncharacterized protein n=1 Tax=Romanomermis culicivorax TaxID=13658 RepID=A0A915K7M2_ROMCU